MDPNTNFINPSFNFQQQIVKDKDYKCKFFDNFELTLIYTSTESKNFENQIKQTKIPPLVSVSFCAVGNIAYFCYCCQNKCCVIQYTKLDPIISLINRMSIHCMIYLKPEDYDYMISIHEDVKKNVKKIPENQLNEIISEYSSVDSIFFKPLNLQYSGDDMSFAKFLSISHLLICAFYIRRNYFCMNRFEFSYPPSCPSCELGFKQYHESDFYSIRYIQAKLVILSLERNDGYICARKFYPDRFLFDKEKEIIMQLKWHPNILNCFGYIDDDPSTSPSLLFEFAANSSLDNFFESGKTIDDTTKSRMLYQILGALDYLHMNGIIHQDLVPENIFVSADYKIYIGHFWRSRIYLEQDKFDPPQGFSFNDDLALYGFLIYEIANMKLYRDRKEYPNITAGQRINFVFQNKMPNLPAEFGSIVELYEKCVRNDLSNRLSTFIYLYQFSNYYYYFFDADLNDLFENVYNNQIHELPKTPVRKDIQYVQYMASKKDPDPQSLFRLALFYREGGYFRKEIRSSHLKLKKASNMALQEATFELISEFINGEENGFTPVMCKSMLDDFSQQNGFDKAKFLYSKYIFEKPDEFSEEKKNFAKELIIQVCQVNADAQVYLSDLLFDGKIFQKDDKNALAYLQEAAKHASGDAVFRLALVYEQGLPNLIQKDDKKALKYYFLAAGFRNESALNILVQKYKGLELKDKIQAFKLLNVAAEQRYLTGLKFIGIIYRDWATNKNNTDSPKDKEKMMTKAMTYLTYAADQNDMDCMFEMAYRYCNHQDVDQDFFQAFKFYKKYREMGGKQTIKDLETQYQINP